MTHRNAFSHWLGERFALGVLVACAWICACSTDLSVGEVLGGGTAGAAAASGL